MSTYISIYLEHLVGGSWLFEGERRENIDYDPEDPGDQPEYGPEPLFLGPNPPLLYLLGYPVDTILEGPPPPFGQRGLPQDLSAELARWATADELNRFHGWVTARELVTFDWTVVTAVRMVMERKHLKYYRDSVENSIRSDRVIDWSNMRSLGPITARDFPELAPDIYADITWRPSYAAMAGYNFMEEVVQTLSRRYGPSEDYRIIYWVN
jgi:hypothetical protein